MMNEDELMHYGRLGMKWHKHIYGPEKAYAITSKRHDRMANRVRNKEIEAGRQTHFHITSRGKRKEIKAVRKARQAVGALKTYERRIDKEFSEKKLSKMEQKYINKGKAYVEKKKQNPDKREKYDVKIQDAKRRQKEASELRKKLYGR